MLWKDLLIDQVCRRPKTVIGKNRKKKLKYKRGLWLTSYNKGPPIYCYVLVPSWDFFQHDEIAKLLCHACSCWKFWTAFTTSKLSWYKSLSPKKGIGVMMGQREQLASLAYEARGCLLGGIFRFRYWTGTGQV